MKSRLVLICCMVLLGSLLYNKMLMAQSAYSINTAKDMNGQMTTDITRDRNNNMWVGSYNGLYKHEGSRIRSFNKLGRNNQSLSSLEMHTVYEDKKGFIWVGTTNGLDKIDPNTYTIQHFYLKSADKLSSFVGYIYSIFQDDEDAIWISTDAALFKMDYTSGQYKTIPVTKDKTGVPSVLVAYNSGIKTGQGIWFHTTAGMVYYEYASRQFYHQYHNPQNKFIFKLTKGAIVNQSDLTVDKKGNMWFVANRDLLISYNWKTNRLDSFRFIPPPNAWFCCYSVKADWQSNIWIGFRHGGLLIFNTQTNNFSTIQLQHINGLIHSNYIYALEEDYQGNMWVSTDNGIDVVNLYEKSVKKTLLSARPDFTNIVYQSGDITSDGNDGIFIPFYSFGFFRYDLRLDSITKFTAGNKKTKGCTYILPDNENLVWAAREKKLVPVLLKNATNASFSYTSILPKEVENYPGDIIWHFRVSKDAVYIKKNRGSIYYFNKDSVEIMEGYGFKKNIALSFDKKSLWFVDSGLNLQKRNLVTCKNEIIPLQRLLKETNFSFSNPRDIIDDGEYIWMTGQNGLLRYHYKSKKISSFTMQEGLIHNFTFALLLDTKGRVWVSSSGGINLFEASKNMFKTVVRFSNTSYMDAFGSALETNNGELIFHAGNKIYRVNPEEYIKERGFQQQLIFQEVQLNGTPVNWTNKDNLQNLSYVQNRLLFRFGLLNFEAYHNHTYWYRLQGLDEEWISNDDRPEVSFNSLAPGKYVFHLKVLDASGKEMAAAIKLPFVIRPPFWQTWWFRLIVLSIIALFIYWLVRKRINSIRAKAAIKQQISELEGKALRAQMNPHFIFNSLNAIQECIVMEKIDAAYEYLARFSKLLRMVLNNSEKNIISLQEEMEMISLYLELESLRFKNAFEYSIHIDESVDTEMAGVPPLLLQPFIENAIWHGLRNKEGEKKLFISCTDNANGISCTIIDNGVGREKAKEIKAGKMGASNFESKGMVLSEQRMRMMNLKHHEKFDLQIHDLYDEKGSACGTKVILQLPQLLT